MTKMRFELGEFGSRCHVLYHHMFYVSHPSILDAKVLVSTTIMLKPETISVEIEGL